MLVTPQLARELAVPPWLRVAGGRRASPIGPRVGIRVGPRIGLAVGPNGDPIGGSGNPFAGIARDATSNIYVPASSAQWTQFRGAAGLAMANPNSLWLCQEAAGNLADSIGAVTLTATGAPLYNQAVAGWTRLGVSASADGAADRFVAGAGVGPDPATTSQLWLMLTLLPATPAAARLFSGLNVTGAANNCRLGHAAATGNMRTQVNGVNADSAGPISTEFHALAFKYDRAAPICNFYNNDEKISTAFVASIDGNKGFCNGSLAKVVYACMWSGAAAEASDANLKALLQAMGFAIAWS